MEQTTIENILKDHTYQLILKESCGGLMFDVANRNKYDTKKLLELFNSLPHEISNGIMKGVKNFITS